MDTNKNLFTPSYIFIAYLFIINIYGIIIMGIDKWKSSRHKWRTPEKTLFMTAFLGGAAGVFSGMKLFHHKTLHSKFKYGIPVIFFINIIIAAFVFKALA